MGDLSFMVLEDTLTQLYVRGVNAIVASKKL